jgi:hypothetical protein
MKTAKIATTNVNVKLSPEAHQALRMHCAKERTTAQRVVEELILRMLIANGSLVKETEEVN